MTNLHNGMYGFICLQGVNSHLTGFSPFELMFGRDNYLWSPCNFEVTRSYPHRSSNSSSRPERNFNKHHNSSKCRNREANNTAKNGMTSRVSWGHCSLAWSIHHTGEIHSTHLYHLNTSKRKENKNFPQKSPQTFHQASSRNHASHHCNST